VQKAETPVATGVSSVYYVKKRSHILHLFPRLGQAPDFVRQKSCCQIKA